MITFFCFRANKSHVISGYVQNHENGYERFYDFEKRESEEFSVLCTNKDFEVVHNGEIDDGEALNICGI